MTEREKAVAWRVRCSSGCFHLLDYEPTNCPDCMKPAEPEPLYAYLAPQRDREALDSPRLGFVVEALGTLIQASRDEGEGQLADDIENLANRLRAILAKEAVSPPAERERALEDLVVHCWAHSGYDRCGFEQMTTEQKALFGTILAKEPDDEL